jgi:hypothetical protein
MTSIGMLNGYVVGGAKIAVAICVARTTAISHRRATTCGLWVTTPGQWTVDAQYNQLKYKDNADKGQKLVLRGTYNLSKRTAPMPRWAI